MLLLDSQNLFDQPVKNDVRTYDKIRKNVTGPGHTYTTGCLLHYPISKNIIR